MVTIKKKRAAIFVAPEVHHNFKRLAVEERVTFQELLERMMVVYRKSVSKR